MVTLDRRTKTVHHNLLGLLVAVYKDVFGLLMPIKNEVNCQKMVFLRGINLSLISTPTNDIEFAFLSYKCFNLPKKNIDWEVTRAI